MFKLYFCICIYRPFYGLEQKNDKKGFMYLYRVNYKESLSSWIFLTSHPLILVNSMPRTCLDQRAKPWPCQIAREFTVQWHFRVVTRVMHSFFAPFPILRFSRMKMRSLEYGGQVGCLLESNITSLCPFKWRLASKDQGKRQQLSSFPPNLLFGSYLALASYKT